MKEKAVSVHEPPSSPEGNKERKESRSNSKRAETRAQNETNERKRHWSPVDRSRVSTSCCLCCMRAAWLIAQAAAVRVFVAVTFDRKGFSSVGGSTPL
jgi:hypothetical protein